MNEEGKVPFDQTWCFPGDLKATLGSSWFEILPTPDQFASGRPKYLARFFGDGYGVNRPIIAQRDAMELTSKKTGRPYYVCRREATPVKVAPLKAVAKIARFTAEDVLAE